MRHLLIPVTPFQQNCTLLICARTGDAAVIDPGGEPERIAAALDQHGARAVAILLTHGHLDHVGAAPQLAARLSVPILGPHRDDAFLLDSLPLQARMFGFPPHAPFRPTRWLDHGEQLAIGEETLEVLHCPGHAPGHLAFFNRAAALAQVGDILFQRGIGRTDLPRGDLAQLLDSIRERLFPLGDAVRVIPGHGPMTTLGAERRHNPFVGIAA